MDSGLLYVYPKYDELHLILNMLWLTWFWLLMADAGLRARTLTAIYFAGGLAAAAAYAMIAPDGLLLGSSGAVMGVVAAAAVVTPRRRIDLPLMKPVSVALAAGIIIAINLLCMMLDATWSNIAHLAGIAAGAAVASLAGARFGKSYNDRGKPSDGHANDALIDKLRTSGFSSLSPSGGAPSSTIPANNNNLYIHHHHPSIANMKKMALAACIVAAGSFCRFGRSGPRQSFPSAILRHRLRHTTV